MGNETASRGCTKIVRYIDFGEGGNSAKFRREGWHENVHGVWALARGARVVIPIRGDAGGAEHIVVVCISPFIIRGGRPGRHVRIDFGGNEVFSGDLSDETVLGFVLPSVENKLVLTLTFQNSESLNDAPSVIGGQVKGIWLFASDANSTEGSPERYPAIQAATLENCCKSVEQLTGLAASELLARFESLGHSCDFGITQRAFGVEPLGLLRWGGISTACAFKGIIERFRRFGGPGSVEAYLPDGGGEYWLLERAYQIHFHSFRSAGEVTKPQLEALEMRRLPFLRRKFVEDMDLAERIFILKRPHPMHDAEALAVWAALNTWGRHYLLYVSPRPDGEAGAVDRIGPRLFRGSVDLGPHAGPTSETWLSVCAHAARLTDMDRRPPP